MLTDTEGVGAAGELAGTGVPVPSDGGEVVPEPCAELTLAGVANSHAGPTPGGADGGDATGGPGSAGIEPLPELVAHDAVPAANVSGKIRREAKKWRTRITALPQVCLQEPPICVGAPPDSWAI